VYQNAAEGLALLACVSQTGVHTFAQDLTFELCEHGQHSGHGAAGGCGEVEGSGE